LAPGRAVQLSSWYLFLPTKKVEAPVDCVKIYLHEEDFMNQTLIILTAAVVLYILYFYRIRSRKGGRKQRALWQECRRKLRLPPKVADETIERYIKSLKESHPNHSEEWYLEKIIYDLDRDRR
jgi:hypothetical protein